MNYSRILIFCLCPIFVFSQPVNDHCQEAVELFCGDELWVHLFEADNLIPENFEDCGPWENDPGVWYTITGTGDYIHLSTCNDYSLNLKVFTGDCNSITCLSPIVDFPTYQCDADEHKEVAFLSEYGIPYYIYCRSNSASTFGRLQVNCYSPLINDICQEAKPIILDSTYIYDHRFGNPSYHDSCLDDFYRTLTDSWYTFEGNGGYIQVDNFSENLLTSCLLKGACDSREFVSPDFISGDRAYLTELGATYFLQIVNHNPQPQQIRLRSFQRAENDLCVGATPFPLQDTLTLTFNNTVSSIKACTTNEGTYDRWYYFTGNDSIVTFTWRPYTRFTGTRVRILTGTCDSLVCETMTRAANQVSVPTISGKRYWVNIHNSNAYEFGTPVEVTATITAPLENDEYTGATPLQCGDTLQGTLAYALEDQAINGFFDIRSVWYRVIGTGEYYSVTTRDPFHIFAFEKRFFTQQNGSLTPASFDTPNFTFLKKDTIYFLNITGSYNTVFNDFDIYVDSYLNKEGSKNCDDTISLKGNYLYDQVFKAGQIITSSANLASHTEVIYQAGEQIVLLPGFQTKAEGKFRALIQNCEQTLCLTKNAYNSSKIIEENRPIEIRPQEVQRLEIFPNPFSNNATVRFFVPISCHVKLTLHNFQGSLLSSLFNGAKEKGWYDLNIDGTRLPNGNYILSLQSPLGMVNRKIVLIN